MRPPSGSQAAWVVATVEGRYDGQVELKRDAPPGIDSKVVVKEEDFAKLTPVTGDPSMAVEDLVSLNDVNTGAMLNNLRVRYEKDEIFTAIVPILSEFAGAWPGQAGTGSARRTRASPPNSPAT